MLHELRGGKCRGLGAAAEAPVVQHLRDRPADVVPRVRPVLGDVEPLAAVRGRAARRGGGGVQDEVQVRDWEQRSAVSASGR